MTKERADRLVVKQGLAATRERARALIMAGLVRRGEEKVEKPGQMLKTDLALSLKETLPYVSRGGLKLAGAIHTFGISVSGKVAVDLGASTGGFTDCLLQEGAVRVYAVDVDTRQLDWTLRRDPRVVPIEKNARYLEGADLPESPGIVTMDLSFISVLKILPAVAGFLESADLIALIKPQFEVGKGQVGKKGIVRDLRLHEDVLMRIIAGGAKLGFVMRDVMRSPIRGQKGNTEYLLLWNREKTAGPPPDAEEMIREAVWNEKD